MKTKIHKKIELTNRCTLTNQKWLIVHLWMKALSYSAKKWEKILISIKMNSNSIYNNNNFTTKNSNFNNNKNIKILQILRRRIR